MSPIKIYNEEYFTSMNNFNGYLFEDLYPYFSYIAKGLIKTFNFDNVLDIGCAKGFLVCALLKYGADVYGVEVSKYAVSDAPNEVKGTLILAEAEQYNLPFRNRSFDLVLLLDVIEHLHTHDYLLLEIMRILKPSGICIIKTPIEGSEQADQDHTHINIHNKKFWQATFRNIGFQQANNRTLINETWVKFYQNVNPSTRIGRFLTKFGTSGGYVRKKLIQISTYYALKDAIFVLKKV